MKRGPALDFALAAAFPLLWLGLVTGSVARLSAYHFQTDGAEPEQGLARQGTSAEQAPTTALPADREAGVEEPVDDEDTEVFIDPLGPNAACYVCHLTFVREPISMDHLAEDTGCIDCHGISAAHANDENIGATPPDVLYKRHEVDAACAECHETHDAPASLVVARFLDRRLPAKVTPICTDCHGYHRIDRAAEAL